TGLLAHVRCEQGDLDEARRLVDLAAELGQEGDVSTDAICSAVRGLLEMHAGAMEEACALVDDAVAIIGRSDMTTFTADIYAMRAEIYRRAGKGDVARRSLDLALELYRAKGDRADLVRLEAAPT
ncbi:MAG: hypothetical protein ACRDWE_05185, partial [Acidimicrobiales bacterium]